MPARRTPTSEPHPENGHQAPRAEDREPPAPVPGEGTTVEAPRRVSGTPGTGIGPGSEIPPFEEEFGFLHEDIPDLPVIVEGLIHQGTKMAISGGSKSYKTWSFIDLNVSVAAGLPWLGRETKKGKVLYVNFELQRGFFQKRLRAVMEARGVTPEQIRGKFSILNMRDVKFGSPGTLIQKLIDRTAGKNYLMITLDPLYMLYGDNDENSASEMAKVMSELGDLGGKSGAAVLFGHHFSKGNQSGKDMRDRGSGSGVIMRNVDTIMTMTAHKEEDTFIVECVPRNFPPWKPLVVRPEHPLMVVDEDADPTDFRPANASRRAPDFPDEQVLALLDAAPLRQTDWKQRALEELGMAGSTFNNRLKALKQSDAVVLEGSLYRRVEQPLSPVRQAMRRAANQG